MFTISPQIKAAASTIKIGLIVIALAFSFHLGSSLATLKAENKASIKELATQKDAANLQKLAKTEEKQVLEKAEEKKEKIRIVEKKVIKLVTEKIHENPEKDSYCAIDQYDVGLLNEARGYDLPDATDVADNNSEATSQNSNGDYQGAKLSTVIQSDIELAAHCEAMRINYNSLIEWYENVYGHHSDK